MLAQNMGLSLFVPPIRTTRPYHVDEIFQEHTRAPSLTSSHRSADSVASSVATPTDNQYDAGRKYQELRAMTPAFSDNDNDDRSSLRSFAMSFTIRRPRWNLLKKLSRRNQGSVDESCTEIEAPRSFPRKMSVNTLTSMHSRQNTSMQLSPTRTMPSTQLEVVPELSSRKCYYSIARNCPGWVLGGSHGDSCEQCLRLGFFGSP